MERVIRFRAWDGKRMLNNIGVHPNISMVHEGYEADEDGAMTISPRMTSYKIMQFTGLQDKNGKDCYDKDVDEDGNMIGWCDRCSGWQFFIIDIPTKDIISCHNCEGNFMLQDHIGDFVIAGNIYEGINSNH